MIGSALLACEPAPTSTEPAPVAAGSEAARTDPTPPPVSAPPECRIELAPEPPRLLVTHGATLRAGTSAAPPPVRAPRPRMRRDAQGRRVIELDCLDCIVANVSLLAWDGAAILLGPGHSPRVQDGAIAWLQWAEDGSPRLARRSPDGTIVLGPARAGAVPLIGGFARASAAPFTSDGRYQLSACDRESADACEADAARGAAIALYRDDPRFAGRPIDRLGVTSCSDRCRADLFLSEDATVLAGCVRAAQATDASDDRHFLRVERASGERHDRLITGRCLAFDEHADRAIVALRSGAGTLAALELHDRRVPDAIALTSRTEVEAAAFTPCGEAVILAGPARDEELVRLERIDLARLEATTLLEAPLDPRADDFALEVGHGWIVLIASSTEGRGPARLWAIPIGGGEPRTLVLETETLWDVTLGPS